MEEVEVGVEAPSVSALLPLQSWTDSIFAFMNSSEQPCLSLVIISPMLASLSALTSLWEFC